MAQVRIALPADKDAIMAFAKTQITAADPMEREMQSWNARWRAEALDHYLPQGWSFVALDDDKVVGFLIAQPLLFFRGLTQTLWVEDVLGPDAEALIEAARAWARDKHLQCVLCDDGQREIKTARY